MNEFLELVAVPIVAFIAAFCVGYFYDDIKSFVTKTKKG